MVIYQQKKTTVKNLCAMFNISKPTLYKVIEEISKNQIS
ncbi:helix-turn-helix domain-containing protein [Clostridium sp. AWRP]|nr:helix-turn-helix domain-containing protein [Clostridium sp. AWRP]